MTDFGQFQPPFAEVPLDPAEPDYTVEPDTDRDDMWWVDEGEGN